MKKMVLDTKTDNPLREEIIIKKIGGANALKEYIYILTMASSGNLP